MRKYLRSSDYLLFEVSDRIARITLNRPEKRNALHPAMLAELRDALTEADALNDVNVVILEGAGKDFCCFVLRTKRSSCPNSSVESLTTQ